MVCTFFGNRDAPMAVAATLREVLRRLVEEEGVTQFYVGQQGAFDRMVIGELERLSSLFSHIRWAVVWAYYPTESTKNVPTLFPEGLEQVPPRFAINKRNAWMLDKADVVITYTRNPHSNAAAWKENAKKRGKHVIELNEMQENSRVGRYP